MKAVLKCVPRLFKNGYLLIPATASDKYQLSSICESIGSGVATVTVSHTKRLKTYDQCKTVFALITLYFFIIKGRYPTESEKALVYSKLLWQYAPRTEDPLNPDETVPIPLSEMSVQQAAIFINSIMGEIYEYKNGLTDYQEIELKRLFEEFYGANGFGENNPIDYDSEGNLLTEAEWRLKNNFSFASGIQDETLQLHHILSRGAFPQYADCAWNWIMLTDDEHNRMFHDHGWEYFLNIFPHCARRIKEAFDRGHQVYSLDLQKALFKLDLIDEMGMDSEPTEVPSSTEDLASLALSAQRLLNK